MRRNKDGSIMIITLGFVLVFTMMGMASIHLAGLQNENAERKKHKAEAFWLADGGIELAKLNLSDGFSEVEMVDQDRSYTVNVERETAKLSDGSDYTYQFRWKVRSDADVYSESKKIEAVFNNFTFPTYNPDDLASQVGVELTTGEFQFQAFRASTALPEFVISVANVSNEAGGFFVVDATEANSEGVVPFFAIQQGTYNGVISIVGDVIITDFGASIFGDEVATRVRGALYDNGKLVDHDAITYDSVLIDKAFEEAGAISGTPVMVAWNEQ